MKTNKISIKNRKIKLKDKYSRKYIGGAATGRGTPPGPPSGDPDPVLAAKVKAEKEEQTKAFAELEKNKTSGMSQIKTIQNDLFTQLNSFNDEQIRNLTTPMINAVKRLSSKPQTDTLEGPNQITIEEELDRFLGLLNDGINPNQIYCIDEYLQKELSLKSIYSTVSSKMSKYNPYAVSPHMDKFDDAKTEQLQGHINTTNNLTDTSNKFKNTLIKLLGAVQKNKDTGERF